MKRSPWQRKVKAPIEPLPLAHIKAVLERLKQGEGKRPCGVEGCSMIARQI